MPTAIGVAVSVPKVSSSGGSGSVPTTTGTPLGLLLAITRVTSGPPVAGGTPFGLLLTITK